MTQTMQAQIASKAQELAVLYRNHPAGIMNCLDALGCKEDEVNEVIGAVSDGSTDEQVSQAISVALLTLQ